MLSPPPAHLRPNEPMIIAALSGRALARSARRGGYPVIVLDLYNDLDTRNDAMRSDAIAGDSDGFEPDALLQRARECMPADIVPGSGFEAAPALLERLAQLAPERQVHGNTAPVVARVKDPRVFFRLLDKLGIPHPEVRLVPPETDEGWLIKRIGGHGGLHIRPLACPASPAMQADERHYFQRIAAGRPASVLFLADGTRARIVGFNEQSPRPVGNAPYAYGGAINRLDLSPHLEHEIAIALDALVAATRLVGLNGMDFMVDGEDFQVLEINPRPPATLDLHDADYACGLFHLHIEACRGRLWSSLPDITSVRGHAVVYAGVPSGVPAWLPAWCSDLPEPGSRFAAGMPICTVHASSHSVDEVRRMLEEREAIVAGAMITEAAA
jgi:predicted ATP-grasp superfamily ATP-dependent carboligase